MSSQMEEVPCYWLDWTRKEWPRSLSVFSGDKDWLNTSKLSSELDNSTTSPSSVSSFSFSSFSSLTTGREEEAPTLGMPSNIGVVRWTPSGIGPLARKLGATTLILCSRESLDLMTHLGV